MSAWGDFLDARLRLIHEWHEGGIPGGSRHPTAAEIAASLNHHDATQIQMLLATPVDSTLPNGYRSMASVQLEYFTRVYNHLQGNVTKTAKVLGIGRTSVYRFLARKTKAGEMKHFQSRMK
jgi:DNA-binding NtrC family response regulator